MKNDSELGAECQRLRELMRRLLITLDGFIDETYPANAPIRKLLAEAWEAAIDEPMAQLDPDSVESMAEETL